MIDLPCANDLKINIIIQNSLQYLKPRQESLLLFTNGTQEDLELPIKNEMQKKIFTCCNSEIFGSIISTYRKITKNLQISKNLGHFQISNTLLW